MEAIHAMQNHRNTVDSQVMGLTEVNMNHKMGNRKRELAMISEFNDNRNLSRSSSKIYPKIKRQFSTPCSTLLDDDKTKTQKLDTRKSIRILKNFLKINDTLAAILGILGLFFAVVEYELFYDDTNKERYTSTTTCTLLRSFVSITTAVIIALLIIHSLLSYQLTGQQKKKAEGAEVTFFSSNEFKQLILEIIVIGIHCPPKWDYWFTVRQLGASVDYSMDGILMVWMLLRFYLVFRLFAQYSKWTKELAEQSCELEGCEANTTFAMKAVLKEKPFTSLLCLMVISAIIFGLAVRHFERPYYYGWSPLTTGFQDYSYIWNGMWLIMITMMTVGYGDFYPKTHMGRFVCILACFWGVFLVSMMVVTLTVVSSFEQKESRAYDILFRLNIKEDIRKKAAFVITYITRIYSLKKKFLKKKIQREQYMKERIILQSKLDVKMQYYRDAAAKISAYEITPEEALRQLTEKIDRDLDEVKEILLSLIEMEKQLNEIEQSQMMVANAMNECINFTNNLEDHLNEYKEKVVKKISLIKSAKEKKGGLIGEEARLILAEDLKVKKGSSIMTKSQENEIKKLISSE